MWRRRACAKALLLAAATRSVAQRAARARISMRAARERPSDAGLVRRIDASQPVALREALMLKPTAAGSAFQVFSALWRLLGRRERRGFLGLLLVSVLMAVATLGGVASILPFFALLGDPERIAAGTALGSVYAALGFDSRGHFLVFLGWASYLR